jgi:hypothetical protein
MWELTQFLLEKEKAGKLTLNFHAKAIFANGGTYDEGIGLELKKLSQQGKVIGYGGNFHSRKIVAKEIPSLIPAGFYTGPSFVHVAIGAANSGEAWFCGGSDMPCGVHAVSTSSYAKSAPGALVDGDLVGHDYIFFVDHFTASVPHLKP